MLHNNQQLRHLKKLLNPGEIWQHNTTIHIEDDAILKALKQNGRHNNTRTAK